VLEAVRGDGDAHATTLDTPVTDKRDQFTVKDPLETDGADNAGEVTVVIVSFGTLVTAPLGGQKEAKATMTTDITEMKSRKCKSNFVGFMSSNCGNDANLITFIFLWKYFDSSNQREP
jgi:hypothetical protein